MGLCVSNSPLHLRSDKRDVILGIYKGRVAPNLDDFIPLHLY